MSSQSLVVLDAIIWSLQRAGGISLYWAELASNLITDGQFDVTLIEYPHNNVIRSEYRELDAFCRRRKALPLLLERLRSCSLGTRQGEGRIFHSSYYRLPRERGCPTVVTIHDFMPELFGGGARAKMQAWQKRRAAMHADRIICISENTRSDLFRYIPTIDPAKVLVVYNGVSDQFYPDPEAWSERDKPFALFVGNRSGYKNFVAAVEAVARRPELNLVAVGGGALTEAELRLLEKQLPGRYRHVTAVGVNELNNLYNRAFCLIYPSAYEGFGLPVLEAMKAGCPVVAVDTSSIGELARGVGCLADSAEPEALAMLLEDLEGAEHRDKVIQAGFDRAAMFSWRKCARETAAVYQSLL